MTRFHSCGPTVGAQASRASTAFRDAESQLRQQNRAQTTTPELVAREERLRIRVMELECGRAARACARPGHARPGAHPLRRAPQNPRNRDCAGAGGTEGGVGGLDPGFGRSRRSGGWAPLLVGIGPLCDRRPGRVPERSACARSRRRVRHLLGRRPLAAQHDVVVTDGAGATRLLRRWLRLRVMRRDRRPGLGTRPARTAGTARLISAASCRIPSVSRRRRSC